MWKFVTGAKEMARLHIFAPFNPELLGALSSKNFSKKKPTI
jgi:hypothetical protein